MTRFYIKLLISISILCMIVIFKHLYTNQYFDSIQIKEIVNKVNNDTNLVLCIIMTTEKNIFERCPTVWDTWAKKCDKALFASNFKNLTNILSSDKKKEIFPNVDLDKIINLPKLDLNITESYDFMAKKAMEILKVTFELYHNEFNWFLLIDDDTFVFVENLKLFMSKKNPKEPFTYGYNFKEVLPSGYHSGGGGVLFTHESLKRIYTNIKAGNCNFVDGYGDIAVGECSQRSSVKIGFSLDELGRERFHCLDLTSHFNGFFPDWMFTYPTNAVKKGRDCCSEQSITFHYTTLEEMVKFSNISTPTNISALFNTIPL